MRPFHAVWLKSQGEFLHLTILIQNLCNPCQGVSVSVTVPVPLLCPQIWQYVPQISNIGKNSSFLFLLQEKFPVCLLYYLIFLLLELEYC